MGIPSVYGLMLGYHPWILSPTVVGFEEAKVMDLIDLISRKWDVNLLHGLFDPQEEKLIMSTPLCHTFVEDKLIWLFTSSGIFTVKSNYNFLAKENLDNLTSGNPMHGSGIWKLVLGLNVPNKVKNFIWHSCRDDVPVKKNLKNRKILPINICDNCKQSLKSILHAL